MAFGWVWTVAARELRLAIGRPPNDYGSRRFRASYLTSQGRFGAQEAALARAIELDPFSASILGNRAHLAALAPRSEKALEHGRRAVAFDPSHAGNRWMHGVALTLAGAYDQAIDELTQA